MLETLQLRKRRRLLYAAKPAAKRAKKKMFPEAKRGECLDPLRTNTERQPFITHAFRNDRYGPCSPYSKASFPHSRAMSRSMSPSTYSATGIPRARISANSACAAAASR